MIIWTNFSEIWSKYDNFLWQIVIENAACIMWAILIKAYFLSLAWSKLRLCSANHRPGYWSNLAYDWPSTAWAYSKQETENGPRPQCITCSPSTHLGQMVGEAGSHVVQTVNHCRRAAGPEVWRDILQDGVATLQNLAHMKCVSYFTPN